MEILGTCQYILSLCAKAKEYVANKKFYPAIKVYMDCSLGWACANMVLVDSGPASANPFEKYYRVRVW
jgi:hypothetical protein